MDKKSKVILIGCGAMLLGGVLVVVGLLQIPIIPVVLILAGGGLGFLGYRVYKNKNNIKPEDLYFG